MINCLVCKLSFLYSIINYKGITFISRYSILGYRQSISNSDSIKNDIISGFVESDRRTTQEKTSFTNLEFLVLKIMQSLSNSPKEISFLTLLDYDV